MKKIEIDGVCYLVFEDNESGSMFVVKAIEIETSDSFTKEFDRKVIEAYYEVSG